MIDIILVEMMLLQYAAGGLTPAEAVMVASHAAMNPKARRKIEAYEAIGGQLLCDGQTRAVTPDCLDKIMARIDSADAPAACATTAAREPLPADCGLPETIRDLINTSCKTRHSAWAALNNGIEVIYLKTCTDTAPAQRLRLLRLAPHQTAPQHRHKGIEITLVLDGGFHDQTGHYEAGDMIVIDDPDFVHAPTADAAGCICLTLTEAPLRFQSTTIRVLNFFKRF